MAQADVLRMVAEIETGGANANIARLGDALKQLGGAAEGVAVPWKSLQKLTSDFNNELIKVRGEMGGVNNAMDDATGRVGRLGGAVGSHMPQARQHVTDFSHSWLDAQRRLTEANDVITRQVGPALAAMNLGALTAAGSLGGLVAIYKQFGDSGAAMENLSKHTGFATRDLQGYIGVAREAGITTDSMSSSIENIGTKIAQMHRFDLGGADGLLAKVRQSLGGAGAAADMQRTLQGPGTDQEKNNQILERYIELLRQVRATHSESYTREYASETSGSPDLANLTRFSGEELHRRMELAEKMRGVYDPKQIEAYEQAWNKLNNSIVGFQTILGGALATNLSTVVDKLSEFISASNQSMGKGVSGFMTSVADNMPQVLKDLEGVAAALTTVQNLFNYAGKLGYQSVTAPIERAAVGHELGADDFKLHPMQGLPTVAPEENKHQNSVQSLLHSMHIPGFDVGSEGITRGGLGVLHEGETVVPAESSGPFSQIHNEESQRTLQENTTEIKKLNERLDKLLENTDPDSGWGPGTGSGSGSSRGGGSGPGGGGPGGSGPGGGGPGGSGSGSDSGPGSGPDSAPGGSIGKPGGSAFEDSLAASKPGGYASALGLDKFPASLPANHPAMAAAQAQARSMSTGGATGGGAGAAGITGLGSGFSPVGGGGLGTAAGGGDVAAGAGGAVNPNALFQSYVSHFKGSKLDGYVPEDGAKFGITKGTPEEWAKLAIASTAQESGLNAHVRDGLNQFNAQDLKNYGVNGAVSDPNAQIQAQVNQWTSSIPRDHVISGAGRGPHGSWGGASAYFGPFRRFGQTNELSKHFGWADKIARANTSSGPPDASASASPPSAPDGVHPPSAPGHDDIIDVSGSGPGKVGPLASGGMMRGDPQGFMVHHTGGRESSPQQLANELRSRKDVSPQGASVQYFIGRDGKKYRMMPEGSIAWHAGRLEKSQAVAGQQLGNQNLEGVEVAARDENDVLPIQRKAIAELNAERALRYGRDPRNSVWGHGELTGRKERMEGHTAALIRGGEIPSPDVSHGVSGPPTGTAQNQGLKPWPSDAPKPPIAVADGAPKPPTGWQTHDLKSWPTADSKVGGAYSTKGDTFVAGSSGHLKSSDYDAEVKKRFGDGDTPRAGELSAKAEAGKAEALKHTVEGKGHIDVHVRAPRGTDVKAKGSGMFQKTSLNRSFAGERSPEHSNPSETQPR